MHLENHEGLPLCDGLRDIECTSRIASCDCDNCLVDLDLAIEEDMVDVAPTGCVIWVKDWEVSNVSRFMRHLEDDEETEFLLSDAMIVSKRSNVKLPDVLRTLVDAGYKVKHVDDLDNKNMDLGSCFGFGGLR